MAEFTLKVPEGDDRERLVCGACGYVAYENPKVVVGSLVIEDGAVLLCRRAIEPRRGYWTLPAGFLELGESAEAGARREAWEEARARLQIEGLFAVYSIERINQIQLIYRAALAEPGVAPGPESLEVRFFGWADLPWDELSFPSVHWTLRHGEATRGASLGQPFMGPPVPDASPLILERPQP